MNKKIMLSISVAFFLCLLCNSVQVSAADTWICSRDKDGQQIDYYLDLEQIVDKPGEPAFTVPCKVLKDGILSKNDRMLFTRWNKNDWYCKYESSSVYPSLVNSYYIDQALFDACAPYSKWAQKYPRRK